MKKQTEPVGVRAILLSSVIILGTSYWLGYTEMIWHTTHLTTIAVPANVVFVILLLALFNAVARKAVPRRALRQTELLTVYAMVATGSSFSGHDFLPRLMGLLPHAYRYATPENDWQAIFFRYLPKWLLIDQPRAVKAFYEGDANFFTGGYWRVWVGPLAVWATVILLMMVIFLCLTVFLREQWVTRERLAYPLTQVPFMLTTEGGGLFTVRTYWFGFLIAGTMAFWNGLEWFIPALPRFPLKDIDLSVYLTEKPWNSMGGVPIRIHPMLTGIGYLLPLDILVSVVFFYVFRKTLMVVGGTMGWTKVPGFPFSGEQGTGALFALLVMVLWTGREHISRVAGQIKRPETRTETDSPMSYRVAMIVFVASLVCLLAICVKAGMSVFGFVLFIVAYLAIVVGLTRIRAELGPPIHAIGYVSPQYLLVSILGTRRLGPGRLTVLSLLNWLSGWSTGTFRTHAMPHDMEVFKLADRAGIRPRSMLRALFLAGFVGIVESLIMYPAQIYSGGVPAAAEQINYGGSETYTFLGSWLQFPKPPDPMGVGVIVVTFFVNMGMFLLRSRAAWFSLHPAGYVIGIAPGHTDVLWFPLFTAIFLKWTILRAGGFRAYRRGVPFFLGLVSGEVLFVGFWPLVSLATRTNIYSWI